MEAVMVAIAVVVILVGWIAGARLGLWNSSRRPTVLGVGHNSLVQVKKGQYAMVLEEDDDPLPLWPWGRFRVLMVEPKGALGKKRFFRRWELRLLRGKEKEEVWRFIKNAHRIPPRVA